MIFKKLFLFVFCLSCFSCKTNRKFSEAQGENRTPASRKVNKGEFCNWGFMGPKQFKCQGKTYVYGVVSCSSSGYTDFNAFCEEKYSSNGPDCSANKKALSAQLGSCYHQMQRSNNKNRPPLSEFCNWGFVGPKQFKCQGKTYVYGVVSCSSSGYTDFNAFCEEKYSSNGPDCSANKRALSAQPGSCYHQMRQLHSR